MANIALFTVVFGNWCFPHLIYPARELVFIYWGLIWQIRIFLLPKQLCLHKKKKKKSTQPNCPLVMGWVGIRPHPAHIIYDKVIKNLSGKVLLCWQVKSFQPHGQTKSLCVGGQFSDGFADSAPLGFVWSHPSPTNSVQLWIKYCCWRGAVNHEQKSRSVLCLRPQQ